MEALLGFIVAGLGALVWFGVAKSKATEMVQRFGPIIQNVYDVVDPIAGDLLGDKYQGTIVQEAIELAVLRVADGDIDQEDVTAITAYVVDKFNPTLASSKVLDPSTQKGAATAELAESLKQLADGTNFVELAGIARKASAIL
jgi:flagellar basal body-associated protein FliL